MARAQHLSRLAAPATWPIKRKGIKWLVKVSPGPHGMEYSMPLLIYLRDLLNITKNIAETKKVLSKGLVKVNSKVRRKIRFPVGLFDVIEIPSMKKYWRVILNKRGKLDIIEISETEAKLIPLKIVSKSTLKKGRIQLNLSNGWNLLNGKNYSIGDVLILNTEKGDIVKHLKLEKGKLVYIIGGKHIGNLAIFKDVKEVGLLKKEKIAILDSLSGEQWQSPLNQIFVIGDKKPEIKIE